MDLKNKNVIYIGGFGGIGFASCKCFLQNGIANLIIFDLKEDAEKLEALQKINGGANVSYIHLDVTDEKNIESAFSEAFEKVKNFDVVVNGSGIMNEHKIENTLKVNLLGTIHSSLTALKYMDQSNGGRGGLIVNVSSLVALDAYGGYAVYTASKYGVNGFTRALADPFYFEKTNVGFITICPSTTETPMLAALRVDPVSTFDHRPPLPASLDNSQTAEQCGEHLVAAVKTAKNGSFWISRAGELTEYHYPKV